MKGRERQITFRLTIVTEPDGDGFYAYAPALKGLHTCGDTEEEALRNAVDAAIAYLRSLLKHGDPIPVGPDFSLTIQPVSPERASQESLKLHEEDLKLEVHA